MSDATVPVPHSDSPDGRGEALAQGSAEGERRGSKREGKVVVLRDFCMATKGARCNRCEIACPKSAISCSAEGLPLVDAAACTQCGICFGICDAFSSTRVTMLDLHERVRGIALRGETAYFTCKENIFPGLAVAANVVVLPCLACLSPEFWTVVLSENIQVKVACDLSYCAGCERAGENAEMLYSHAIQTAEEWASEKIGFSEVIPEKEALMEGLAKPDELDRRSAFTNIIEDVGDIATGKRRLRNSEVLQRFVERRERSKALAQLRFAEGDLLNDFAPTGRVRKIMIPKRQMLLEAIAAHPEIAKNIPVFVARVDQERCTGNQDCLSACPTGALSPHPDTGKRSQDLRYCIGCGICTDACPNTAITLEETTAESLLVDQSQQPVEAAP